MAQDSNSPPEVTNVVAQQVGQQVEITYDLLEQDGDLMRPSLATRWARIHMSITDIMCESFEQLLGQGPMTSTRYLLRVLSPPYLSMYYSPTYL